MSVLEQYVDAGERPAATRSLSVVSASNLIKRYGQGDAHVDALRGVSLEIEERRMTAIMGPSGSGKSTLMHILAGLDRPTEGEARIAGLEISSMSDAELTRLRREHIGFVFQFFNLLPMLTAEENIVLPLSIAGEKADRRVGRGASGDRGDRRPADPPPIGTVRRSAAAGLDRSRAGCAGRRFCSPTSRPATSTRTPRETCSRCCAIRSTTLDKRS